MTFKIFMQAVYPLRIKVLHLLIWPVLLIQAVSAQATDSFSVVNYSGSLIYPSGHQFGLKSTTDVVIYSSSYYEIEVAILKSTSNILDAGKDWRNFDSYKNYKSVARSKQKTAVTHVRLGKGSYMLAIRDPSVKSIFGFGNFGSIRVELNKLPKIGIKSRKIIATGSGLATSAQRRVIDFSIMPNKKYIVDGCNKDVYFTIIDRQWSNLFLNFQDYYYYTEYTGSNGSSPDRWELNLPPGDYCLALTSYSDAGSPYAFTIDEYEIR